VFGFKYWLASAERDDAANRIVGRDPDSHTIARYYLDSETAHPPAQLCEDFMPRVNLDAIQAAGVNRHDGALHINEIVFAQKALPFGIS
jgi:hypothetical protein